MKDSVITELAREAGLDVYRDDLHCHETNSAQQSVAARFVQLVAEECAKLCDEHQAPTGLEQMFSPRDCADMIRDKFGKDAPVDHRGVTECETPNISAKQIAEWRALQGDGMTSAVGEYTPSEFWTLLDAYEALLLRTRGVGIPVKDQQ